MTRQFRQDVDVARDQSVFRQDGNRVPEFGNDFETAPGNPQLALDRLITIGHPAHHQELRFPFWRGQFGFERSEEHTSELQSHLNLVCRLLLEKKKKHRTSKKPSVKTTTQGH